MSLALRWLLLLTMWAAMGCGYLDEEILLTDETFEAGLGGGTLVGDISGYGRSSGCGGIGGYGYGRGGAGGGGVGGVGMSSYDLEEIRILGSLLAGEQQSFSGVDQAEEFARDRAPEGTIEAVIYETVQAREEALVQFAQARSSRAAR